MATVIDSLLIELGLDASKFDAAQKKTVEGIRKFDEQSTKSNKQAQEGSKKIAEGWQKATNALAGFGNVALGAKGFGDLVTTMISGNAELGRTSTLLGMSAQDLTAWGTVMKGVGGTADDFVGSMQNIKGALARLKMGMGGTEILLPMAKLGLNLNNVADPFAQSNAIKAYVKSHGKDGVEEAFLLAQGIGVNQKTFNALLDTQGTLKTDYAAALKQANIDKAATDAAAATAKKTAALGSTLDHIKQTSFQALEPAIDFLTDEANKLASKFAKLNDDTGGGAGIGAGVGAGAFTTFASWKGVKWIKGLFSKTPPVPGAGSSAGGLGGQIASKGLTALEIFGRGVNIAGLMLTPSAIGADSSELAYARMSPAERHAADLARTGHGTHPNNRWGALEDKYGLPAGLLDAQWMAESARGKSKGRSLKGAMGDMQFMPAAAKRWGVKDRMNLEQSMEGAAKYDSFLLHLFGGDADKMLAGYNAGEGNVGKAIRKAHKKGGDWKDWLPVRSETLPYIDKIMAQTRRNQAAMNSTSTSEVNIGTINVNAPKITDANGVAKALPRAFKENALLSSSLSGAQ